MQRSQWLLTFSSDSPDITLDDLRIVGGFRLDECYATTGVRHKFVLLSVDVDSKGLIELRCMERFVLRMQREHGVYPSAMPGSCAIVSDLGRSGKDIWLHPGFRVMVDRLRHLDHHRLFVWINGHSISRGLLHKHGDVRSRKDTSTTMTKTREAVLANR